MEKLLIQEILYQTRLEDVTNAYVYLLDQAMKMAL